MDDPDAPHGTFVHWVIWGLDPASGGLEEGQVPSTASEGGNDFGNRGYGGPCPPKGHGTHRYVFTLMALSEPLSLAPGASSDDVRQAAQATTLDTATLIGLYSR
jgi:Raf kinase inhibitor-like YbhB/YbcL family protein